jgi:predicted nucleic acid-binding Zn finger protein
MTDLSVIPCKCGQTMCQIIDYAERVRRGWYCQHCRAWENAIGRERLVSIGQNPDNCNNAG